MAGIAFLRRLLLKQAMKKSAPFQHEGIMSINKNLVNDVEATVKKWVKSAKKQGQDIDKMGEQEIKYIVELNKPKVKQKTLQEFIEQLGLNDPKKNRFLQKEGEVVDMTGKTIDTSKGIMGGTQVDIVTETIATIKSKKPIDAMKEANSVIGRKGKYKNLTQEQSQKILKETDDHIFERDIKYDEFGEIIKPDPEDLAQGGRTGTGLNYLLGEDDQNVRMPFKKGHSAGRRKFLKVAAGLATIPIVGKYFKWAKPLAKSSKVLTSVPIKAGVDGMPAWFKPLVNQVIKKGDDVSEGFASAERQVVHKTKLPDSQTDVIVTQDLTSGNVSVDIGLEKHGFSSGHLGQPARLEYKAGEWIEPIKGKKGTKTKEEFWVEEAEFTGGHPENVKFEESVSSKFGSHGSDFTEVEKFATGKIKKQPLQKYPSNRIKSIDEGPDNWPTTIEKKASGGRVPLGVGGLAGMLGE